MTDDAITEPTDEPFAEAADEPTEESIAEPIAEPGGPVTGETASSPPDADDEAPVDLDAIERDLAAVEQALDRLSDGSYWTDEITGEPLPDELLDTDPTARRA